MDIVLHMESANLSKVRDILLTDSKVNLASILFKDGKGFGLEGYVCYISGTDELCKRALELVKVKDAAGTEIELAKQLDDKKAKEIIQKIKEEEAKAIDGFGSLFG